MNKIKPSMRLINQPISCFMKHWKLRSIMIEKDNYYNYVPYMKTCIHSTKWKIIWFCSDPLKSVVGLQAEIPKRGRGVRHLGKMPKYSRNVFGCSPCGTKVCHYNFVPYRCRWEQNEIIWFERIQASCQSMYLAAVAARFSWKHWSFTSFSPRITSFLIFSIKLTYCPQWTHFAEIENKKFLH